ncbi:MAG: diacylglycerol kinase [Candidatus Magasanikbacteria bacterium]
MKPKNMFKSFHYAWKGTVYVFRHEQNFRLQLAAGFFIFSLGLFLGLSRAETIVLLLLVFLVLILELLNSALEKFVDILKPRLHSQVEIVKDIMAAMVLCASIGAVVIGAILFWPYLFR